MALEKEYVDIRKDFGTDQYRELVKRLVLSRWQHYKGGHYIILAIYWDAVEDEWAIRYMKDGKNDRITFGRTISNWVSDAIRHDDGLPVARWTEIARVR